MPVVEMSATLGKSYTHASGTQQPCMWHDMLAVDSEFGGGEPTMRIQIHSLETSGLAKDDVCPISREEFGVLCTPLVQTTVDLRDTQAQESDSCDTQSQTLDPPDSRNQPEPCFVPDQPHLKIARLPCGHHFSILPLVKWLTIKNMRCPLCREGPDARLSIASLPRHLREQFRELQNAYGGNGMSLLYERGAQVSLDDDDVDMDHHWFPSWVSRGLTVTCPNNDCPFGDEVVLTMRVEDREGAHVHAESFFLRGAGTCYNASHLDYFTAMMWLSRNREPHSVTFELYNWQEGVEVLAARSPAMYIPLLPPSPFVFMEGASEDSTYSVHWV